MKDLEKYAKENNIPIMLEDGIEFLLEFIEKNNIKSILEIGSAIGYSAIRMALLNKNIKVTTIERDIERYNEAVKNIKNYNLEDQIEIINDDAFNVNLNCKYDLIFIDAAKSQYIKFFEKFKINLKNNGYIVSDNLNFHGLTNSDPKDLSRNVRGLVRKLNNYVEFLKNNNEFETKFYDIGDGVSISTKKTNAFTLVELLGVIVILAAIALIAFPPLLNQIKKSQDDIDDATKTIIENSAKLYLSDNQNEYYRRAGNTFCVTIDELIKTDHLEQGITDAVEINASEKTVKVIVGDNDIYEIVDNASCKQKIETTMCIAATEDTKLDGNIPVSGEYNYGDAYRCDPGDGIERTFYVLEDGDNTTLVDGDTGTTGAGEVSLIMHGIIGRETPWISEEDYEKSNKGGTYSNDLGPITALNNLHRFTSNWLAIPTLPTAYQIAKASHDSSWAPDKVDVAHKNLPGWLTTGDNNYDGVPTFHGKETDIPTYGYWTSTAVEEEKYEQYAWPVSGHLYVSETSDFVSGLIGRSDYMSIIPVITIPKTELK